MIGSRSDSILKTENGKLKRKMQRKTKNKKKNNTKNDSVVQIIFRKFL